MPSNMPNIETLGITVFKKKNIMDFFLLVVIETPVLHETQFFKQFLQGKSLPSYAKFDLVIRKDIV